MKRDSVAFKLLCWFIDHPGIINAKTHYDLALAIGVHPGTATYQRISCDLRVRLGLSIPCVHVNDLDKYFLPHSELDKARKIRDAVIGPSVAPTTNSSETDGTSSAPALPPSGAGAISTSTGPPCTASAPGFFCGLRQGHHGNHAALRNGLS